MPRSNRFAHILVRVDHFFSPSCPVIEPRLRPHSGTSAARSRKIVPLVTNVPSELAVAASPTCFAQTKILRPRSARSSRLGITSTPFELPAYLHAQVVDRLTRITTSLRVVAPSAREPLRQTKPERKQRRPNGRERKTPGPRETGASVANRYRPLQEMRSIQPKEIPTSARAVLQITRTPARFGKCLRRISA